MVQENQEIMKMYLQQLKRNNRKNVNFLVSYFNTIFKLESINYFFNL